MNAALNMCKKCTQREMDINKGILCGLTHEKPDFEHECPYFEEKELAKQQAVSEKNKPRNSQELKPNAQRAQVAMTLISIVLGLEVVSLVSSGMQYSLLQTISEGRPVSDATAEANDLREQIIAIVYMIVYIISGITFLRWFRRAYYNLHQKVTKLSNTDGWAVAAWFIPIVNLYMPYQIMKELYVKTKNYFFSLGFDTYVSLHLRLLVFWWTLWIGNNIFGQIIYRMSKDAASLTQLANITILSIIGSVIGVVLAIVTIRVIKNYADAECKLLEHEERLTEVEE
jgi:uncharacterized membrane protein